MCSPISHRTLARMKFAPFGNDSIVLLNADRGCQVLGAIDVADHTGVADRDFHQRILVGSEQALGALVAAEHDQLLVKIAGDALRVAAPRAEARRREPRALL